MTYHLSKRDEKWLLPLLLTLARKKETTFLKAADPKRLLYLLRQASHSQDYTWLREEYILKLQPDGVLLKARKSEVSLPEKPKEDQIGVMIHEELDLLGIVNLLISSKPMVITFVTITKLDADDLTRLETYCEVNDYEIIKNNDNSLTLKKNN